MKSFMNAGPLVLASWAYGVTRAIRNVGFAIILSTNTSAAEPVTIAALGDSLTQGYGLPANQGFVPQLNAWLRSQDADVQLINAGVSGDTTAGGLSRVDWTLTPNVNALIVALGGNDLLRGIDPAVSKENLAGILKAAALRSLPVLLVGMDAPSNYGAEYETAFDEMYGELANEFGVFLYPNFLGALVARKDTADTLRRFMQPDGIHPNAEGVALIVNDFGPSVLELVTAAENGGS
ncbi:MAG: arylesterase [Boseongicola sp.]